MRPSDAIKQIALARMTEDERLCNWGNAAVAIDDILAYLDQRHDDSLLEMVRYHRTVPQ